MRTESVRKVEEDALGKCSCGLSLPRLRRWYPPSGRGSSPESQTARATVCESQNMKEEREGEERNAL